MYNYPLVHDQRGSGMLPFNMNPIPTILTHPAMLKFLAKPWFLQGVFHMNRGILPTFFQSCPFGKNRLVWYTIYHHLPVVKGVNKPLYSSTNQWEKDIYGYPKYINNQLYRHIMFLLPVSECSPLV